MCRYFHQIRGDSSSVGVTKNTEHTLAVHKTFLATKSIIVVNTLLKRIIITAKLISPHPSSQTLLDNHKIFSTNLTALLRLSKLAIFSLFISIVSVTKDCQIHSFTFSLCDDDTDQKALIVVDDREGAIKIVKNPNFP